LPYTGLEIEKAYHLYFGNLNLICVQINCGVLLPNSCIIFERMEGATINLTGKSKAKVCLLNNWRRRKTKREDIQFVVPSFVDLV
jgi:hypothetical protein